jgi:putative endonuclease
VLRTFLPWIPDLVPLAKTLAPLVRDTNICSLHSSGTAAIIASSICTSEQILMGFYFGYIMASRRNGTLYVGVTNDLVRRMSEHKGKLVPGFTRKYGVDKLVYFEQYASILEARARERALKRWRRTWKLALIEEMNPQWRDLTNELAF